MQNLSVKYKNEHNLYSELNINKCGQLKQVHKMEFCNNDFILSLQVYNVHRIPQVLSSTIFWCFPGVDNPFLLTHLDNMEF